MVLVFLSSQNLPNPLILDFIINQKFIMVYILWVLEVTLVQECLEYFRPQKYLDKIIIMLTKDYLSLYAKSFNWAGFFLPKKTYEKCSALYDFCRTVDNIADEENSLEIKKKIF